MLSDAIYSWYCHQMQFQDPLVPHIDGSEFLHHECIFEKIIAFFQPTDRKDPSIDMLRGLLSVASYRLCGHNLLSLSFMTSPELSDWIWSAIRLG